MSSTVQVEKSLVEALFSGLADRNSSIKVPTVTLVLSNHTDCYRKPEVKPSVREKVREAFNNLPQIVTHRTHGWTTATEREAFVSLWAGGISQKEIAEKFAVSVLTVNNYCRRAARKQLKF